MMRNRISWLGVVQDSPIGDFQHRCYAVISIFNECKAMKIATCLSLLVITFTEPSHVSELLKSDQHGVIVHGPQHICQSLR